MSKTTSFLLVDGSDIARRAERRDAQARLPEPSPAASRAMDPVKPIVDLLPRELWR